MRKQCSGSPTQCLNLASSPGSATKNQKKAWSHLHHFPFVLCQQAWFGVHQSRSSILITIAVLRLALELMVGKINAAISVASGRLGKSFWQETLPSLPERVEVIPVAGGTVEDHGSIHGNWRCSLTWYNGRYADGRQALMVCTVSVRKCSVLCSFSSQAKHGWWHTNDERPIMNGYRIWSIHKSRGTQWYLHWIGWYFHCRSRLLVAPWARTFLQFLHMCDTICRLNVINYC